MMRALLAIGTLVSVVFFPWPFTALLAVLASFSEPLIPLAAGIFADALYYSSHAARLPWFTIGGAAVSALVFFIRSQLKANSVLDI